MKTGCLIIARYDSRRLPGKALLPLGGKPVLSILANRMRQARHVDKIILCTSTLPTDDILVEWAAMEGVSSMRGHPDDVLERMHEAAILHDLDYIIHTGGDCPFTDPFAADAIVEQFMKDGTDLITSLELPMGMFSYGIKVSALAKVMQIKTGTETAAWGKYFMDTGMFSFAEVRLPQHIRRPDIRVTIDYPEDYTVACAVYDALFAKGEPVKAETIIAWLDDHPEIRTVNAHCAALYQKEWSAQSPLLLKPEYNPHIQQVAV